MAVNSKADKTHEHKSMSVDGKSSGLKATSYAQMPPTVDPLSGKIGTAGQKALLTRAKKILAPLADPNQAPID